MRQLERQLSEAESPPDSPRVTSVYEDARSIDFDEDWGDYIDEIIDDVGESDDEDTYGEDAA